MLSNFIAAFAAPSIAVVALGLGGSIASEKANGSPYGAMLPELSSGLAHSHTEALFARADIDESGALDTDEYASLAVVTAELARLNGFLTFELGQTPRIVALPVAARKVLTVGERIRIEAVARRDFYLAAGADSSMSAVEFGAERTARFSEADRNRNGSLTKRELVSFVARAASVVRSDA